MQAGWAPGTNRPMAMSHNASSVCPTMQLVYVRQQKLWGSWARVHEVLQWQGGEEASNPILTHSPQPHFVQATVQCPDLVPVPRYGVQRCGATFRWAQWPGRVLVWRFASL